MYNSIDYKKSHDRLVQMVLKRDLSESQLHDIYIGWNEFYKHPEKYVDTVIIQMVLLSLE